MSKGLTQGENSYTGLGLNLHQRWTICWVRPLLSTWLYHKTHTKLHASLSLKIVCIFYLLVWKTICYWFRSILYGHVLCLQFRAVILWPKGDNSHSYHLCLPVLLGNLIIFVFWRSLFASVCHYDEFNVFCKIKGDHCLLKKCRLLFRLSFTEEDFVHFCIWHTTPLIASNESTHLFFTKKTCAYFNFLCGIFTHFLGKAAGSAKSVWIMQSCVQEYSLIYEICNTCCSF